MHHAAHEASAYLAAPFDRMAVMTLDGRGERASTTFGVYRDGRYRRLKQVDYPHSLGLLYERVTAYLGFLHSSDEYKVMALASYGEPRHVQAFRALVHVDGDGGYRVANTRLEELFGPARERASARQRTVRFDLGSARCRRCRHRTGRSAPGGLRDARRAELEDGARLLARGARVSDRLHRR